jgi:hypothetical protein
LAAIIAPRELHEEFAALGKAISNEAARIVPMSSGTQDADTQ